MKWLSAGLIFVNLSAVCGLLLGMAGNGLTRLSALLALISGAAFAVAAYLGTFDAVIREPVANSPVGEQKSTESGQRQTDADAQEQVSSPLWRYRHIWFWAMAIWFAVFAVRSFCWLLYIDGNELKIQSPYNLGDLSLHITLIRNFVNGIALWPDSPIYVFGKLRYPAGIDLFNALLCLVHIDLIRGLVWTGLIASLATFYAFFRWAGTFGVAGFLFNGGAAGFKFFKTLKFLDYQGEKTIAWKSIALTMFVTQRGLLYAIPAGLLLLWHWRAKFFRENAQDRHSGPLPFWVELSLYASMPLFHVHTFIALSAVLVSLFVCGDSAIRKHVAILMGAALLPATFFVALVSDNFHASSMVQWDPGWVLHDHDMGRGSWLEFWLVNFGLWFPLILVLLAMCGLRAYKSGDYWKFELFATIAALTFGLAFWRIAVSGPKWQPDVFLALGLSLLAWFVWHVRHGGPTWNKKLPEEITFLTAAIAIFLAGMLFEFAEWGWDNLKLMIWGYFLVLPFLWRDLIARWDFPERVALCIVLFSSGLISLLGGLAAGHPGFELIDRARLDAVGLAVRALPVEARFAAYPTYNHPLLLQGRKVVLGYPGHLWTEGINYDNESALLSTLMRGDSGWREAAQALRVRYIFWGQDEMTNYPSSSRPWEITTQRVGSGDWGAIYDLLPTNG
ncbi:MAG: hypothetical protein DME54_12985 [Verrucomicrobia bacterium]|nr:MAG: hypothetical protein DME54_12985 [Verrucomicrobiota bacterium]